MTGSVDQGIVGQSDILFFAAFVVYLLAFAGYIVQYAKYQGARLTESAAARVAEPALVGGNDADPGAAAPPEPPADAARDKVVYEKVGRTAFLLTLVGFALHLGAMVLRGVGTQRAPWGNMFEFIMLTCVLGVAAGIAMLRTPRARLAWVFVLVPVLLLMFVAGAKLYATGAPVVPALRSYWLIIHVSIISLGSGVFLVSGAASVMYLLRSHVDGGSGTGFLAALVRPMPVLDKLDQLAYRSAVIAFPVFGIGIICGAIWAEAAWGRFWGWDPKETVSFITWVIYAAYLHARATSGWKERAAAWINVVGFVSMIFNLFAINLVVSGLHSYAGLN